MSATSKIAALVTCGAVICGAAILWPVYKEKATQQKLVEAARAYRLSAEQGDAQAQHKLGNLYREGQGVLQDHAQAVYWFRKAAEQGLPKSQVNLASMYLEGHGVPRDYAEAVRWYREAAG